MGGIIAMQQSVVIACPTEHLDRVRNFVSRLGELLTGLTLDEREQSGLDETTSGVWIAIDDGDQPAGGVRLAGVAPSNRSRERAHSK